MSGESLLGYFFGGGLPTFGRSDSPEGAKHEAYAQTEAAQKLPARSKSIADKVRSYAAGNSGVNLQERPRGAIAGMARSYREASRAPMRHKKARTPMKVRGLRCDHGIDQGMTNPTSILPREALEYGQI
jgi:hypothetical protein